MDIGVSASVDVNNHYGLYTYTCKSTQNPFMDKLENDITKFLNIQDDKVGVPGSKPPHRKYDTYFSIPTTFPSPIKTTPSVEAITCKESTPCDNPKFIPVSAMKGSREKRGVTPPEKLTVKWAPDVYDPVPTSVSHTVTNSKPQRQTKKSSKAKHKSSCGSKYRDKKQGRKRGGGSSSTASFMPPDQEEEVVADYGQSPPLPTAMEFHVGNPDQFCGTSFLKRYDANQVHYPSLRS